MLKYLKIILTLRQVADIYEAENGKEKPVYLSRRFWGVLIATLASVYRIMTGDTIDVDAGLFSQSITTLISSGITIYGIIMTVIGQIDKKKKGGKS